MALDIWLHLVAVQWSPQKVISRERQGFTEALAREGRRNREQPSALHGTGFRENKTCPQITNQISPKTVRNLHASPSLKAMTAGLASFLSFV